MAKKPSLTPSRSHSPRAAVTADRFKRLHRLLQLLATRPQTRDTLSRRLDLDVRGFYRDLEVLREAGVRVTLASGKYGLGVDLDQALDQLPFPDPLLTYGEARILGRGNTSANRKLREQIERVVR
jgi:hypothetical protein